MSSDRLPLDTLLAAPRLITVLACQDEEKTPIKQDIKKGKLRFYPYNINWCVPAAS